MYNKTYPIVIVTKRLLRIMIEYSIVLISRIYTFNVSITSITQHFYYNDLLHNT